MTWKDEIKKNVKFGDTAYANEKLGEKTFKRVHRAEKEILEKLMKEVDKIPDGVLQFLITPNNKFAKRPLNSRQRIEKSLKQKVANLLEQSALEDYPQLFKNLMENELFASVLGDMKYDVEYTRDE